jgi:hypothetical protein
MKNFNKFISEEISIRGNKGIPEEKLRDIERQGREMVSGQSEMQLGRRLMELLGQSKSFTRGKEKELEKLAIDVIRETYGIILHNVELEATLEPDGNKIAEFMKKEDDDKRKLQDQQEKDNKKQIEELEKELEDLDEEDEDYEEDKKEIENLLDELKGEEPDYTEEELKSAVQVRKLMNNFIQGEAKNTKHMLHTDEVKEGLEKIYGENWRQAFSIWDEITKTADKMDWLIDPNFRARMMENAPGGMAGAVSCRFPKKKQKRTKKQEQKDKEAADEILKSLEEGEDITKKSEEIQRLVSVAKPTIRAKGVDFPMLLHELVKGVFEMIADVAMPASKKLATEVHRQTSTFADEAEDWRYGPFLARDLNNFVMRNPKIDTYPNLKERVFAKLISKKLFTDEQILENLKNIFLNSPEGQRLVDKLVDDSIKELEPYYTALADWERKQKESEEEERYTSDLEQEDTEEIDSEIESEIDRLINQTSKAESERDYSDMSQKEILDLIDAALDEGDFDTVKNLSQYLKEGAEIFLREIERINESQKYHERRK